MKPFDIPLTIVRSNICITRCVETGPQSANPLTVLVDGFTPGMANCRLGHRIEDAGLDQATRFLVRGGHVEDAFESFGRRQRFVDVSADDHVQLPGPASGPEPLAAPHGRGVGFLRPLSPRDAAA